MWLTLISLLRIHSRPQNFGSKACCSLSCGVVHIYIYIYTSQVCWIFIYIYMSYMCWIFIYLYIGNHFLKNSGFYTLVGLQDLLVLHFLLFHVYACDYFYSLLNYIVLEVWIKLLSVHITCIFCIWSSITGFPPFISAYWLFLASK